MNSESVKDHARIVLILASFVLASAATSSLAYAQAWLPDRNYTEGPGIRAGDLEIHPGIAVRGGYDSNVFRADGDFAPIRGAGILAITPHIHLSTLTQQRLTQGEDKAGAVALMPKLTFRSGLSATYFHYFLDGAPKNLEVDTDTYLSVMPRRPVNFDIALVYKRNVRPFTQQARRDSGRDYALDFISPTARLNFGSRSQVLTGFIGYNPRVAIYESSVFSYLNSVQHGILGGAAWRFLPSTALIYEGQVDLQNYFDPYQQTNSPVLTSDSKSFKTRLGINGALTKFLELRALVGYQAGFFDDRALSDYETPIAEATLSYRFGPATRSRFMVGYLRDAQNSALGGWVRQDRGYFVLSSLLARVLQVSIEGGAAYLKYGRLVGRAATPGADGTVALGANSDFSRDDVRLDGAVRGEYRVTNWFAFTADVSVQALLTEFDYAAQFQGTAIPDPARYVTVSAFGGVRAHY